MNNSQVIDRFLIGGDGRASSLLTYAYSETGWLVSYDTCIAQIDLDTSRVFVSTEGYSNTTKRHLADLRRALAREGFCETGTQIGLRPGGRGSGRVVPFAIWGKGGES